MLLAAGALVGLSCIPLLLAAQLPLVDMPAHLARLEIIDQLFKNGPLAAFYEFEPGLVPNLLFDAVGWLLLQIVPAEAAGAIYLILTLATQLFGTALLHRSLHGRYSYWPLLAVFLLYNVSFFYGYLSYLAGVGLALLSLALWIALRDRPPLLRLAAGSLAAILLFLAHIVPLIVYAAAIAGWELQRAIGLRHRAVTALERLCVGAAQFVVPAILFLVKTPTAGFAGEAAVYRLDIKIGSLLATPTSGAAETDAVVLAAMAVVSLLVPIAFRVRFAKSFATAFVSIVLAFALMPWGLGPAVNLDVRIPLAIMLIAIAASDVRARRERLGAVLASAVAVLVTARMLSVGAQAADFSHRLATYRDAFNRLPERAVLFTAVNDRCLGPVASDGACEESESPALASLIDAPEWLLYPEIYRSRLEIPRHIAALASIDRNVFVPQIFATRGLQPIVVHPSLAVLKTLQRDDPVTMRTPEEVEAITARLRKAAETALPGRPVFLLQQRIVGAADLAPGGAAVVARGPQFTLYRLATAGSHGPAEN